MLIKLKKDWVGIFNSSSVKMNTCSVASLFNQEKQNKKNNNKKTVVAEICDSWIWHFEAL